MTTEPEGIPQNLLYTTTHEWLRVEGTSATIGITDHAQAELTDVVFVDLPSVGRQIQEKGVVLTLESVKTVAEVYAPVSGKVTKVNEELKKNPELVNRDPYGKGWLVAMEFVTKPNNLLSPEKYASLLLASRTASHT